MMLAKGTFGVLAFVSVVILSVAALSGCGSSSPAASGGGVTGTASQYMKLTAGNTWTYNASTTPLVGATVTSSVSNTFGVAVPASGTPNYQVTTSLGVTGTNVLIEYYKIDNTGNFIATAATGSTTSIPLPATFTVGTIFTSVNNASQSITGTIAAINMTKTVAAGTFNDVLQVNYTGTDSTTGATANTSVTIFFSKSAGNVIYLTSTNNIQGTYIKELQPGYTAL